MQHRRFFPMALVAFALAGFGAHAREVTSLDAGWRFEFGDVAGAAQPSFADGAWQTLSLPHCWGWQEAERGEKPRRTTGWYRRDLGLVHPRPGHRYFVRFEAAATQAEVFLNGKSVGQHRGGFGAFCFEITHALAPQGTNVLAVRVSNVEAPDIAPLSGDFPVYGGLYRHGQLLETADVCFTPTDHASPGVTWRQTSVSATQAVLDITAEISNGTRQKASLMLAARVLDAAGNTVASVEQPVAAAPRVTEPHWLRLTIPHAHLWNGRKDPYLHRAIVELRDPDGNVQDAVEQPLGLRSFHVDPDKGFFLNGEPYHLHGVNRHQDRPGKGWAISNADMDEDIALLKELGATVIRCAHYQHSDYFYSRCDEAGILVWAEIPQVDRITDSPAFAETSRNQLLDLIRQNENHPAIFCWSLFNELRPGNPDPHRLLQDLKELANAEDPTRPTIAATCTWGWPQMNKIPDLLGWNIYPGWYSEWKALDDYGRQLDSYRTTSRAGGVCISEYGAGANVNQHEQHPQQPKADGQWHPEEWQAVVHEEAWKQMKARPFIWGTFAWNFADFTSYWRHEGGVKGRNDKGLLTYDRQIKKDAFFFYQANWSDESTIYITSRRDVTRTNAITDVKVYSNAQTAEVFLNGVSQGTRTNDGNAVFLWKNLQLKPGENTVEAQAERAGKPITDRCVWQLAQ